jgi:hypothetical protein
MKNVHIFDNIYLEINIVHVMSLHFKTTEYFSFGYLHLGSF